MENIVNGRNLDYTVLQRRDPMGSGRLRENLITVKDIVQLLLMGKEEVEIRKIYPEIYDDTLLKCGAFLKSKFPHIFEDLEGPSQGSAKILLDENMPLTLVPTLHRYGEIDSVILRGWAGKKDTALYRYAKGNGFQAIITRDAARVESREDRDLNNVSLDLWRDFLSAVDFESSKIVEDPSPQLPVLIVLKSNHPYRDGTMDSFYRHYNQIHSLVTMPLYSRIEVNPRGVVLDESYRISSLWHEIHNTRKEPVIIPREVANHINIISSTPTGQQNGVSKLKDSIRDRVASQLPTLAEDSGIEDILRLVDNVVCDVVKDHGRVEGEQELLLFEMALKSIRKTVLGQKPGFSFAPAEVIENYDAPAV